MSEYSANKALEGYFDDLLSDGTDTSERGPASSERNVTETKRSHPVEVKKRVAAKAKVPLKKAKETPPAADETFTPKPREQHKPKSESASTMELAVLEEYKRQQLQRMLVQQTVPKVEQKVDIQEEKPVEVKEAPTIAEPAVKVSAPAPDVDTTTSLNTELDTQEQTQDYLNWSSNGRPQWAQNKFDVLLFEVAGLSLAVPLVALGQIVPMSDKLTVLRGQSDWFMGILPSPIGDIRTVNTALFVMPERYKDNFIDCAKYVVTIDGLPWGLAVDSVNQPITLGPDDVKWRGERTKRPWLAGTVKSHMCALIDIPQMAQLLEKSDKNRHTQ